MKRFILAIAVLASLTACGGESTGGAEPLSPAIEGTLKMIDARMAAASADDREWACEDGWSGVLTIADLPYKASGSQSKFAEQRKAAAEAYIDQKC